MKQVAIAIENPNNLKELNELLGQGYFVCDHYSVKNTTLFILRKQEPIPLGQRGIEFLENPVNF